MNLIPNMYYYTIVIVTAKILFFFSPSALAENNTCTDITYPAPSGHLNDITFTFDKAYHCGKFANGDWWVSGNDSNGVIITNITPELSDGRNGAEVNPSNNNKQGFDKRISGYDVSLNINLPIQIKSTSSVIKTASISSNKGYCRPCLQFAAVLTIVKKPLKNSKEIMRPGYFGKAKEFFIISQNMIEKLPKFSSRCCSYAKRNDFKRISNRYQGVQLDHLIDWYGRKMHPTDNMPDYGASIATDNASSLLRFMLSDFNINNNVHQSALINYLQMAIDIKSMADNGVIWFAAAGHSNGRKLPLIAASILLSKPSFIKSIQSSVFSEDQQVYYSPAAKKVLFGKQCTDRQYWQTIRTGKGQRTCRDPYGYIDGGGHEIGGAYQTCCTAKPWKYTALAIHLLDAKKMWGNDIFFDYVDRWVNYGVWAKPDPCAPFNGNPEDYNIKYGKNKDNTCITGSGRYINKHRKNKDAGYYADKFSEQMWTHFR